MTVASPSGVLDIAPGFGCRVLNLGEIRELEDLYGYILIWEAPRSNHFYVLSCDVADGLGLDRSVIDITRVGTVREPDEQVAQYVSPEIDVIDLAGVVDTMGRLYKGADEQPALVAIETNNHGLVTQSELQRFYGYDNLYVWEIEEAKDPTHRQSARLGWQTTKRSRPKIISRYVKRVRTVDANGVPDYRINSPFTLAELRDFQTLGTLGEAEADPTAEDAHDDCIMCGAIGLHICQSLQFETGETMADKRRRKVEEEARRVHQASLTGIRRDFRNTDVTWEEMKGYAGPYED